MCEQTPMAYKKGDVVWVKLGPCWWPGEVVSLEELPGGIIESFKKPPLAVVKFFNEENYEFVKNLNNIYLYNCHKKYEFIKKGLDLHRAKHTFMGKFPSDVCAAEEKTDGNPNILNDPQLTPEKRTDYTDIFGLATPKRGAKDSPRFKTKHSFGKHHSSGGSPKKRSSLVTHPRFLSKGKDDHQVRILIQVSEEAKAPSQEYKCHTCGFKSTRVDVIVLHNKSHITGVYTPVSISKKTKQPSPKRAKKPKKPVSPSKKSAEEQRSVLTDFKSDLLAEWNDDDDEEQSTSESINETFSKKHHLEDESDDAKRKKAMKMSHSTTRTLEEDLALAEKGIPLCTESSSDDESEDSLPKTNRKSPQSIDETSCESGNKKELSKTLQSFLDFEKEVAKDNLVVYESEKRKESPVSDESDYVPLKNKRKHAKAPVTKAKKSKVNVTSKAKSDFTTDLLAEWDDDDDDEDEGLAENDDKSEQIGALLNKEKKTLKDEVVKEADCQSVATGKKEKSSCFDFDEDEDTELLARSEEGRKIPRVIPPPTSNNKIPADNESSENQLDSVDAGISPEKMVEKTTEVTVDNDKILEVTERLATPDPDVCNKDEETEAFNNILAATAVPKLPEIPQLLKCEQNFHSAGTIKFPDKNANEDFDCDAEKPEGADTPTAESNDKPEAIARAEEKSTDDAKANEETVPDVVITETQELNVTAETIEEDKAIVINEEESDVQIADVPISKDPECSKIEKNVDIISEDDAPPSESPTPVKSDSPKSDVTFDFQKTTSTDGTKQTEVATKLTNPKKRFVKTFEDETKNLTEKTQEERIPDEVKNVKVSKLKTLLMSKININAYKKRGSARFADYERVTAHKPKGAKGKFDVREIPQKVESRPVLEPVLLAESLDQTITEDVDVKTSVLDSPPREKAKDADDTDSSLLSKEDIAEDDNRKNNEEPKVADLQSKNETSDSSKEEKIDENISESNNLTDLHESKSDSESAPALSDSDPKTADEQQIQENTVADESKMLEEPESLPADDFDAIPEDEVLAQTSLDGEVKFDLGSSDEGTLNNFINEDMAEIEELRPVVEGGNLTIVDENDLADRQVEITTQLEQKPITLSNFSMDFCEDNADVSANCSVTIVDKVEPEDKAKSKVQVDLGPVQDVEENISSFEINKQRKTEEDVAAQGKEIVKTPDENESVGVDDVEKKKEEEKHDVPVVEKEMNLENEVAKITDAAGNDGNVSVEHAEESTSSTKLLEILTDVTLKQEKPPVKPHASVLINKSVAKDKTVTTKILNRIDSKATKIIGKPPVAGTSKVTASKLITEKVKSVAAAESAETLVSVKKVSSKRSYQDVEDIDAFIIQKPLKKMAVAPDASVHDSVQIAPAQKGKARILQQTIITPAGDIIQPIVSQGQGDDNMFDINSMPIVLDDQILTPESIENMPIVLQESPPPPPPTPTPVKSNPVKKISSQQMKLLNKTVSPAPMKETTVTKTQPSLIKQYSSGKPTKVHKVYQTSGSKLLKNNPAVITQPGKPGKFIIVPSTSAPTGNKYTVGKRPPIIKRSTPSVNVSAPSATKVQNIAPEPTGNKIMIVTNNLGQQQRVLLTPVQQKMLAYPSPNTAKIKPALKNSNVQQQKTIAVKESTSAKVPVPKTSVATASAGHVFSPITAQQLKNVKVDPGKTKKLPGQSQKFYLPVNKPSTSGRTIIIKNPQGQTVKRIQSTDDSLMEQQVAEQIQAINRASGKPLLKESSVKNRIPVKKSYAKKPVGDSPKILPQTKAHTPSSTSSSSAAGANKASSLPPLAPISAQKKLDEAHSQTQSITEIGETQLATEDKSEEPKRLPHQLVIQDAHGNQTTITEGQILALPSEAIDGQPQSYVLVTLDETGNLAPLNNEALMSLDPNLSLGGDLGNMVLQIDQGATSESEQAQNEIISGANQEIAATNPVNVLPKPVEHEQLTESAPQNNSMDSNSSLQAVAINSGESGGQQLIITGDPLSTQKFLETLTEGNADLANLLANTKGNILIQAEGQQILINTDTENQMLLTVNPENLGNVENTEGNGNPIFANQPIKNQDILAAALADTDVFQQDQSISHSPSKVIQSQLSPNSALYPIHAGNVLETSSMNSPIMTPLEVPSNNGKKIDDDVDILSQVPKNVDLPITITDPNISQTVAQQQVVSLMAADLPSSTLDLPLAIQDPSSMLSVTSSEMNSPSFVYSLPALDDAVDINQKAFSSSISMPLLTEDPDDATMVVEATPVDADDSKSTSEDVELDLKQAEEGNKSPTGNPEIELSDKKDTFMDAEGLCTMRGGICNSLSEPPPDMFDFSVGNQSYESSGDAAKATTIDIPTESPTNTTTTTTSTTNDTKPDLNEEDSSSCDKSKLDVDSDLKLDDAKPPLDVMYSSNMEMRSPSTNTDDSCEIPVQPEIVTDLTLKNFHNHGAMTDSNFESNGSSLNDESDI